MKDNQPYKMVILIRHDLRLPIGKACSQAAHASVEAVLKSKKAIVEEWQRQGMPKIILKVNSLEELKEYQKKAKESSLTTALIKDAGRTFFKDPTITCLAIGPDKEEKINKIVSKLKLL